MNKELSKESLIRWFSLRREKMSKGWDMFTFTPARYWNRALAASLILLLVILAADTLIFWKLVLLPQDSVTETADSALSLDHTTLTTVLTFLEERSRRFNELQQTGTSTMRNIFSP